MRILLPYKGYMKSAECMTDLHLREQINVVYHTLKGLYNQSMIPGMWKGHVFQLTCFGLSCCWVYQQRGPRQWPTQNVFVQNEFIAQFRNLVDSPTRPPWMGDAWVHRSHRARLIERGHNEGDYEELFPGNPDDIPTFWPQLDDGDSRGYRLLVDRMDMHLLARGVYQMPEGLYLKGREVLEE